MFAQEWWLLVGMLLLAGVLSALIKYVLPLGIRTPSPLGLALAVVAPAAALAVWLILRARARKV